MGFYTSYKAVFDDVKSKLEAKDSIKQVVFSEQLRVKQLPLAFINPESTDITQATFGEMLECAVGFSVIVLVRETEPTDVFEEVATVMGDVIDVVLADRKLSGSVEDVTPVAFTPGEISLPGQKLYWGGVIRFSALMYFTP